MAPAITVFYWPGSPWASKVVSYLALRGLPYTECHQPITMPRPILADLGVKYRRIPVVAIGKDIYVDTLLIIQKLEEFFEGQGHRVMHSQTPTEKALEKLLEKWTDAVVFSKAIDCIPIDHPLVTDPTFIKDRTELWGWEWDPKERAKKRPEGLVGTREFFDFLENTLLVDDRKWVLGGDDVTVADIHTAWIFNWLIALPGSFPEEIISSKIFPRVFALCERYQKAVDAAQEAAKPEVLEGDEAIRRIEAAEFIEKAHGVDVADALGLKEGQEVVVAPTDTGSNYADQGPLVAITKDQVVVGSKTKNGVDIRVHAPRWNFSVRPVKAQTNGH